MPARVYFDLYTLKLLYHRYIDIELDFYLLRKFQLILS